MDTTYTLNGPQGQAIVADMAQASQKITQLLTEQANQIRTQLADWEADDKNSYEEKRREWDGIAAGMPEKLQVVSRTLDELIQAYQQNTQRQVGRWSGYSPRG